MSRPVGHPSKLAGPDHLRALAIILVFLFHYRLFPHPEWVDVVGSFGWTGVDLFFVLSGYLIAGQLFKEAAERQTVAVRTFYTKRFFRIIPAYLTVLMLYFCIPAFREREALPPLWKFVSFTQNFGLDLRHRGTFSHAWSLCIEEQFYLLLPFLILLFIKMKWGRWSVYLIAALFLLGFLFRFFTWSYVLEPLLQTDSFGLAWYEWMYYPSYNRLDGLLVGVGIAGLWQFYPQARSFINRYGNLLPMLAVAILGLAYYVCLDPNSFGASVFGFPLIAIGYGCMLAASISPGCFLYRHRSRITGSIAALSYAVYLGHKGIIHLTQDGAERLGLSPDSDLTFLLCGITVLAGALALRYAIEKPFLALRYILLKQKGKTTDRHTVPVAEGLAEKIHVHTDPLIKAVK